jgi:ABC-2 type transport system ATP-binding protein
MDENGPNPEILHPPEDAHPAMIEVAGLTKRYGRTVAVDNVSFTVRRGEILGFLGPNGAGKTTTMKILTCFILPDKGQATVAGHDIWTESLAVRGVIGYLPESTPLYADMGIIEYLRFCARMRAIPSGRINKAIKRAIELTSLEDELSKNIGQLSRGYRQRVGLAQALLHEPEILIFDEPTSGLDPNQIIEIRELIKRIGREKTILLSTHILPEVTSTCDRAIIIHQGRLVADGTPEELMRKSQRGAAVIARIRGPEPEVREKLGAVPRVRKVVATAVTADVSRYELSVDDDAELGEEIFSLVAQNGWKLSELRRETASLEDVFAQLTGAAEIRGQQPNFQNRD